MARYELNLPAMGEGIIEATITKWLVTAGQFVQAEQPLAEIATDKVDSEIFSPVAGTMIKIIYRDGEIPRVGEVIAIIETEAAAENIQVTALPAMEEKISDHPEQMLPKNRNKENTTVADKTREVRDPLLTPLIRTMGRQRGISTDELKQIRGSGPGGRVTRDDLNKYLIDRQTKGDTYLEDRQYHESPNTEYRQIYTDGPGEGDEIIEMDRMRKIIAEHMVRSKRVSPHVTSFVEVDVTAIVAWREKNKDLFFNKEHIRLTFTPLFVEAAARTLKSYPRVNVSVMQDKILVRKNINIGVATALPGGNLIVPVIMNADRENLKGLATKIADLSNRARENRLLPAEIKGGTFTLTNIGQYNNLTGTPIINQPEAAILAVGTIIKKPWAVRTESGYGVAVRDITMLSLTYDHRVIDGALGGSFLRSLAEYLENFDPLRSI
jgi:2-oxoglutarate dehydrogenase E2 component (dihydrolipoamide succinyltransferase)